MSGNRSFFYCYLLVTRASMSSHHRWGFLAGEWDETSTWLQLTLKKAFFGGGDRCYFRVKFSAMSTIILCSLVNLQLFTEHLLCSRYCIKRPEMSKYKVLTLQAEQNECLLDLPSYVSSLSKPELNLRGQQCEQLWTFFMFVSFPGQNTVRKCQASRWLFLFICFFSGFIIYSSSCRVYLTCCQCIY